MGIWDRSDVKKILYKKIGCLNIQLSQSGPSWQCRYTKVTMKFVSFIQYRFILKTNFSWSNAGYRHFDFDSRHLLGLCRSVSITHVVWISICLLNYCSGFSSCHGVDCARCEEAFQGIDCEMAKLCDTNFGQFIPQCKKNCANTLNCYQKCVKGQKTCNSCCKWITYVRIK